MMERSGIFSQTVISIVQPGRVPLIEEPDGLKESRSNLLLLFFFFCKNYLRGRFKGKIKGLSN